MDKNDGKKKMTRSRRNLFQGFCRKLPAMAAAFLFGFFLWSGAGAVRPEAAETNTLFPYITQPEEGEVTSNVGDHDYKVWSHVVNSYLTQNEDGTFTRVEYTSKKVCVENWSADFTLKDSKTIDMELSVFGGAYMGEDYNFLVFGQNNTGEDDTVEVMRVVKYDKKWNRLSSVSVKGENTYVFASYGSLDMAETSGKLAIHTCHEMYASNDGYHHQANMTFVVDESSMEVTDSYSDIANIRCGYVSHSFNQFVLTDGTYLYRMDHGDAYPRALVLTKASISNIISAKNTELLSIGGTSGNNYTGLSAGGLILTGEKLIAVGNTVDQEAESWSSSGKRNIFTAVTDTSLSTPTVSYLTDYDNDSTVTVGTPYIVEGSSASYVLWEETDSSTERTLVRIAKISNTDGSLITMYDAIYGRLSDCEPILTGDGQLVWYVTDGTGLSFYSIDTDKVSEYAFSEAYSLEDCSISLDMETEEVEFTGSDICPEIAATYQGYTLKEGTDYEVTCSSNKYPGTATVTVTGKGIFEGSWTDTFTITAIDISGYTLVLTPSEIVYDGKMHGSDVIRTVYNGDTEVSCAGYELYYSGANAGEYEITYTGDESYGYKGSLTAYYRIVPKSIENVSVTLSEETYTCDGSAKRPSVTAVDEDRGVTLTRGRDYMVSYENNTNAGTATAVVTFKGNYTGSLTRTFTITKAKDTSTTVGVGNIVISGISGKIAAGKKIKLKAEVSPSDAANGGVVWKTSNKKIATVSQSGLVKVKKRTGGKSVIITATAADGSGVKAVFKIRSMKGVVKKVSIRGAKAVEAGKSLKLKALVKATKKANRKLRWTSANTEYATVTSSGLVKTTEAGKGKTVKITAMATDGSGKKASVKIKIK